MADGKIRKHVPKSRVTSATLVGEVANDLGFPAEDVKAIVKHTVFLIAEHLAAGHSVTLSQYGLGRFDIVKSAPRRGRNMITGKLIDIPAQYRIKFSPVERLRRLDKINGKKE